tara:strand:- start:2151 stop:2345 length:195 start_codon:yes stop_codon:yes gene_type:complete
VYLCWLELPLSLGLHLTGAGWLPRYRAIARLRSAVRGDVCAGFVHEQKGLFIAKERQRYRPFIR